VLSQNFEICQLLIQLTKLYIEKLKQIYMTLFEEELSVGIRSRRGRDRMVVGFTIICAINTYLH
jgi:hypothetical protein